MDELNARYTSLTSEYNKLAEDALATAAQPAKLNENVAKIIQVNTQISSVLDEMIGVLTLAKTSGSQLQIYRDELIQKLEKIQRDYNGLIRESDKLTTLRRIRAFEDDSWKRTLRWYLYAFLAVVVIVGMFLMFKRKSQNADMITATPTNAAAMPPLT
jgi:hypothetical protein